MILKIKILSTKQEARLLFETVKEANAACSDISEVAFQERIFNKVKLPHVVYQDCRTKFKHSTQMIVRLIAKVKDAYTLGKNKKCKFKPFGAIAYDARIMSYKPSNVVSLWCIGGRQKIDFVCCNKEYLPYIQGEAKLTHRKEIFALCQTVDVPMEETADIDEYIGCDFGVTDIVVTSDGVKHAADKLNSYCETRQKVRSSIQAKADTSKRSTRRNCRKLFKRVQGKERTHVTITNHTIAKSIVFSAKKTSNVTDHLGKRTNNHFKCNHCGSHIDADLNAPLNIAVLDAAVNHVEESNTMCCAIGHM